MSSCVFCLNNKVSAEIGYEIDDEFKQKIILSYCRNCYKNWVFERMGDENERGGCQSYEIIYYHISNLFPKMNYLKNNEN
ncbi:hypothetical protein [Spiroplasma endosymbiont of Lasioglossum malachurum]|uniref:hypothetical protein n=1 Tax=Spiroplasma endosymbiont of Lasioglossum malachurum TaxID=3066319 RepID=UPI0030D2B313